MIGSDWLNAIFRSHCLIRNTSRIIIETIKIFQQMKMFLPAKSALNRRADIDMKAFPPISGWNNKLILAGSFIENNGPGRAGPT